MNKSELIDNVADASSVAKREVESVLSALFDTVRTAVRSGDQVAWPGFGSFKGSSRSARTGRNPRTGAAVKIPASKGLKFTPSSALKEFLNTKGSTKKASAAKKSAAKKSPVKKATAGKAAKATKTTKKR